jgi:hypothetical protein
VPALPCRTANATLLEVAMDHADIAEVTEVRGATFEDI